MGYKIRKAIEDAMNQYFKENFIDTLNFKTKVLYNNYEAEYIEVKDFTPEQREVVDWLTAHRYTSFSYPEVIMLEDLDIDHFYRQDIEDWFARVSRAISLSALDPSDLPDTLKIFVLNL